MQSGVDIGVIGLAVMGRNLVLNLDSHGFTVAAYNRTPGRVSEFLANEARGTRVVGATDLQDLVTLLSRPRRVLLMVQAGTAVDAVLEQLTALLQPGDIIIDGGNSHYADTERRVSKLSSQGLHFVGAGVSGGEEGARYGPSIMPGGDAAAWPSIRPMLQAIAAKAPDGTPCCDWVGPGGSGHFVKMVHNGIEYGDMQLICEAYDLLRFGLQMDLPAVSQIFRSWNAGPLESFLIEITAKILDFRDDAGQPLIDRILDAAGQKGTGKWTVETALELGTPLPLMAEAVFARSLSARKEERSCASSLLGESINEFTGNKLVFVADLESALFASKLASYAQGYMMMRASQEGLGWSLSYSGIAQLWRAGCIIRAGFLAEIKTAFERDPELLNLLLDPHLKERVLAALPSWRRVVARAAEMGIPVPGLSSALAFFDGLRRSRSPANLLQAQRDYFGAHTYERVDRPRGEFFHTNWATL